MLIGLVLVLGGFGSGIVKKHMTKDKALTALKARAVSNIKKGNDDVDNDYQAGFPSEFTGFIDLVKKQGQDIEFMKASGALV